MLKNLEERELFDRVISRMSRSIGTTSHWGILANPMAQGSSQIYRDDEMSIFGGWTRMKKKRGILHMAPVFTLEIARHGRPSRTIVLEPEVEEVSSLNSIKAFNYGTDLNRAACLSGSFDMRLGCKTQVVVHPDNNQFEFVFKPMIAILNGELLIKLGKLHICELNEGVVLGYPELLNAATVWFGRTMIDYCSWIPSSYQEHMRNEWGALFSLATYEIERALTWLELNMEYDPGVSLWRGKPTNVAVLGNDLRITPTDVRRSDPTSTGMNTLSGDPYTSTKKVTPFRSSKRVIRL